MRKRESKKGKERTDKGKRESKESTRKEKIGGIGNSKSINKAFYERMRIKQQKSDRLKEREREREKER